MTTLRQALDDPREFMTRLKILTKRQKLQYFHPMWEETSRFVDALVGPKRYVLAVKPRQVAFTTATTAYEFWKGYTSAGSHRCIQVVHEREALVRLMEMVQLFHDHLPPGMQRGLVTHNETRTRYAHNGGGFNRVLAGGRSQGRSWSFTDAHFTEPAFYPQATPAAAQDGAGSSAEGMWQSTLATLDMNNPDTKVVVESTGNGPRGLFYKLAKMARLSPEWAYVFVRWSDVDRYRKVLTHDERQALLDTLSPDEEALMGEPHCLPAEAVAWRREKIETEQWSLPRFRREFPLTDMEPFLGGSSGWFEAEQLNAMLEWATHDLARSTEEWRVFHAPEVGRSYFIGVDTAGGVGRDYAVITVYRDDLVQCAVWMSNTARPRRQAHMIARIGAMYSAADEPLCLIEENKYGREVLAALRALPGRGVRLWKDPDTGSDWWSTEERKREVFVSARDQIEDGRVIIECAWTLLQLQTFVEVWSGKIEGGEEGATEIDKHDDLGMATVLALYAARKTASPKWRDNPLDQYRPRREHVIRARLGFRHA